MNLYPLLFICAWLAGCATKAPASAAPPAAMAMTGRPAASSFRSDSPAIVIPPGTPGMVGMVYGQPLTNCWLEESADLNTWNRTDDFEIETNADGSTGWHIKPQPVPNESFRVGGDAL
jgi:hypothetical protein